MGVDPTTTIGVSFYSGASFNVYLLPASLSSHQVLQGFYKIVDPVELISVVLQVGIIDI